MTISGYKNKHLGKRCFILGSGPSIASQDISLLKNEITICSNWFINHQDISNLNINYYCAYDDAFVTPSVNQDWLDKLESIDVEKFFPEKWKKMNIARYAQYLPYDDQVKVYQVKRFSVDVEKAVYDAGSVVVNFCLPLAFYMGCKEIILLGVETDYGIASSGNIRKEGYFYEFSQQLTPNTHTKDSEREWIQNLLIAYGVVSKVSRKNGVKIINATPGGKIEVFERKQLQDILQV